MQYKYAITLFSCKTWSRNQPWYAMNCLIWQNESRAHQSFLSRY